MIISTQHNNPSVVLIWCANNSPRLEFVVNLIFCDILGLNYTITQDFEAWKCSDHPKIAYHHQDDFPDALCINLKTNLLFEQGIKEIDLHISSHKKTPVLFSCSHFKHFPFDIFAASFYLASRYEEYLPHIRDQHDRYPAHESIAFKENFITLPVINIWASFLWESLKLKFPNLTRKEKKYHFTSTIDVDNAYAYLEKGFIRFTAALIKDIFQGKFSLVKNRFLVWQKIIADPYDTFTYQVNMIKKHQLTIIYFFLLGDYGNYDKNVNVDSKKLQALIKHLADYAIVGIHPSYKSHQNPKQLKVEVDRLANIMHKEVNHSRQHYLRLKLPDTYRNLLELDILKDYTMGYADYFGFRAGLCTPFNFYDLDLEQETCLRIHPFAFMEGTFKDYLNIQPEEALVEIKKLIDVVKKHKGEFISLWHNHSIQNRDEWQDWHKLFEDMIQYGKA